MGHIFANTFTLLACAMTSGVASADPDHTYLEEDGIVLFEVEDADTVDGWELRSDLDDFKGNGYFEWIGPDSFPLSSAGKQGAITYHFRIQTPGNYQIRWRNRIAEGESNTEANDSWLRLATGQDIPDQHPLDGWTKIYMNVLGSWTWTSKTVDHVGEQVRQYFAEGDHTLEISGRSIGHAIDQIAVYRYEDVRDNNYQMNNWKLSNVVTGDGSVVDPNQSTTPEEPTEPDIAPRENLDPADVNAEENEHNTCADNTLFLTASEALSVTSDGTYTAADYLRVSAGESSALLKYDLSLVPAVNETRIEYSTGDQLVNGSIRYSLGSHSNWQENSSDEVEKPDVTVELSQSEGGWEAESRYQSTLPSNILSRDINTLIISADIGSDSLEIVSTGQSNQAPQLLLTGDDNFCRDWQANVDASNGLKEQGEDTGTDSGTTDSGTTDSGTTDSGTTDSGTTDSGTTDSGTTDSGTTGSDSTNTTPPSKSSGSGSLSWLALLAISMTFLRKVFRNTNFSEKLCGFQYTNALNKRAKE